jgi:hypothetical protein
LAQLHQRPDLPVNIKFQDIDFYIRTEKGSKIPNDSETIYDLLEQGYWDVMKTETKLKRGAGLNDNPQNLEVLYVRFDFKNKNANKRLPKA